MGFGKGQVRGIRPGKTRREKIAVIFLSLEQEEGAFRDCFPFSWPSEGSAVWVVSLVQHPALGTAADRQPARPGLWERNWSSSSFCCLWPVLSPLV